MPIVIDFSKCCWKEGTCKKCGCATDGDCCDGCAEACPTEAITRGDVISIDEDLCTECNACIDACPNDALTMGE